MISILIHSSKTMRLGIVPAAAQQTPQLIASARQLAHYLQTLSESALQQSMKLSPAMATKTQQLVAHWQGTPAHTLPTIDAFIGDIYSGLQVQSFSVDDRKFANDHLFILSGIYGILRALDSIQPYRLEMGYRLPVEPYRNLYQFWGERIAASLPAGTDVVNLSAVEYTRAVFPHLINTRIITPKFLTISPKTGEPVFVTVHAKVARGAFAHWLITHRITSVDMLHAFSELNYHYDETLSTTDQPVFVCQQFGGIGMSVRLS